MLNIDFETRSKVNLKTYGAYRYATDPSTHIYMMAWAFDDEPVEVWVPTNQAFPRRVEEHIRTGGPIAAWNAQFERLIFWYVLCNDISFLDEPRLEQFFCTAARARAHGLPGALDDCSRAMNLRVQKQSEGSRLIRTYSAQNILWDDIPVEDQQLFIRYCRQDVEVERTIGKLLRTLTPDEWYEYHLNEHINDLGAPIDLPFAQAATTYADAVRRGADGKIKQLTNGQVKTSRARTDRDTWLLPQLTEAQRAVLQVGNVKEQTVKYSFTETHRNELLADPDLAPDARRYLELVNEGGGASMRKYVAICNRAIEGRVNGVILWNGGGQTGRFSSRGLQLHNMKRATLPDADELIAAVRANQELSDPTTALSGLVRSTIYHPEGLSWFDWSSIEGRIAPWLEGTKLGRAKLKLYRQGVDPYVYNAAQTFGITMDAVDKDQRQAGKLQELALGFLGGVGALKMMGINYGLTISDAQAEKYRDAWRAANPWAKAFGYNLERATLDAMKHPGHWRGAGRVRYIFDGRDWLWCELPSGRLLAYYKPKLEPVELPWGGTRMAVTCVWGAGKPKKGEPWPRRAMHGGLWLENITQGTAADILREAIIRVDDRGLDIILHVHDEIIVQGGNHVQELGKLMLTLPPWAIDLPLEGDGGSGERYGK